MSSSLSRLGSNHEIRKWALPGKCQTHLSKKTMRTAGLKHAREPQVAIQWVKRQLAFENEDADSTSAIMKATFFKCA